MSRLVRNSAVICQIEVVLEKDGVRAAIAMSSHDLHSAIAASEDPILAAISRRTSELTFDIPQTMCLAACDAEAGAKGNLIFGLIESEIDLSYLTCPECSVLKEAVQFVRQPTGNNLGRPGKARLQKVSNQTAQVGLRVGPVRVRSEPDMAMGVVIRLVLSIVAMPPP